MSDRLFDCAPDRSAQAGPQPACGGKRFVQIPGRDQMSFEVRRVEDFVPDDAEVRVIDDIIGMLDFSGLQVRYRGGGRPAFAPEFLCKLLFYGYSVGVRSAREISRRLQYDVRFMWLAHQVRVDHHTLSRFRRDFADQPGSGQLPPMARQVRRNTGHAPQISVADCGYHSGRTLQALEQMSLKSYVGQQRLHHTGRFGHDQFRCEVGRNLYICPAGRELVFKGTKLRPGSRQRIYRARAGDCLSCPLRDCCLPAGARRRELYIDEHAELRRPEVQRRHSLSLAARPTQNPMTPASPNTNNNQTPLLLGQAV